ncbi:hypothetical protein GCM10010270_59460 [Streptomyces violaceus]|nr:hypothetical protein GCM10010270_59460 [Streptomyces janthinus]
MIPALFETPSAYRPTPAQMAAPVPAVEAVLFDFSNTIFDLETWLHPGRRGLRPCGSASGA